MTKYYTCFAVIGKHPRKYHCTHKYLGALSKDDVTYTKAILDAYFSRAANAQPVRATFDVSEVFDDNGSDVRVVAQREDYGEFRFHDPLLEVLDMIAPDSVYPRRYHITTLDEAPSGVAHLFNRYVLIGGGRIVRSWLLCNPFDEIEGAI